MDEVAYGNLSLAVRMPKGVVGFGFSQVGVSSIPLTEKYFLDADNADVYEDLYDFRTIGYFEYVNRLENTDRAKLLSNAFFRQAFASMEEEAGGKSTPKNWVDCISQLEDVSISEAQEFAKLAAEEWLVHEQLTNESDVSALTEAISKFPAPVTPFKETK